MTSSGRRGKRHNQINLKHQYLSAEEFISNLQEQRELGFGFVPLIGAGASAPAGVPLIHDIEKYLRRCIAMALGLPGSEKQYWNPRTDAWPPIDELQHVAIRNECCFYPQDPNWYKIIKEAFEDSQRKCQSRNCDDKVPSQVFQEAIGSLAEWRSSLSFLARLRMDDTRISLGERDQEVVDRFFAYVVQGKSPTLVHRMLALLTNPLRFETILTTNFDDLLDDAIRDLNIPLNVVDVHLQSGLPPYSSVQSRRTLVKLHGGKYGLRADYSLETYPSFEDRRHFASYLLGRSVSASEWEQEGDKGLPVKNHLLVVGYSGGDLRINALIREALLRYVDRVKEADLKVFWVCYSDRDVDQLLDEENGIVTGICKQFESGKTRNHYDNNTRKLAKKVRESFIVTRHSFLDLLFLQLYQDISLGLPPTGIVFPSASELPIPVTTNRSGADVRAFRQEKGTNEQTSDAGFPVYNEYDRIRTQLWLDAAIDYKSKKWPGSHRCIVVSSDRTAHGVTSLASEVFSKQMLVKGRHCVWLDTDDTATPDSLFEQVLGAVALRSGVSDWVPVLLGEDTPNRTSELARLTRRSSREWVIFIHVRDGAGSNVDESTQKQERRFNGWCDDVWKGDTSKTTVTIGQTKHYLAPSTEGFLELLRHISTSECGNVTVVVLCHEGRLLHELRADRDLNVIALTMTPLQRSKEQDPFSVKGTITGAQKWVKWGDLEETYADKSEFVQGVLKYADTVNARKRFLFALVLCAKTRYPSLLWSWAFHGLPFLDNTPKSNSVSSYRDGLLRFRLTHMWLKQLARIRVIRRKPGGFIWLHSAVRDGLREVLRKKKNSRVLEADIHHGLAVWYEKLFAASRDPMAVFEVVYHRCNAAIQGLEGRTTAKHQHTNTHDSKICCRRAVADLHQARTVLAVSKTALLSRTFSRGKLDQLTVVRNQYVGQVRNAVEDVCKSCKTKTRCQLRLDLRLECLEIEKHTHWLSRSIAREIADHTTAFEHTRQYYITAKKLIDTRYASVKCASDEKRQAEWNALREYRHEIGVLDIAARAYQRATRQFQKNYNCVSFPIRELEKLASCKSFDASGGVINPVVQWVTQLTNSASMIQPPLSPPNHNKPSPHNGRDVTVFRRTIYALERHMELCLVQGQLVHLLGRRNLMPPLEYADKDQISFCRVAGVCYCAAIEIMRFLPPEQQAELYHERQRLDTQYGLALAYGRDFVSAHQRLREAESFLSLSPQNEHTLETAIIGLHRAEVYTQQAIFRSNENPDEPTILEKIRKVLLMPVDDRETWESHGRSCKLPPLNTREAKNEFRQCNDFLQQANSRLVVVEQLLGQRRKNVWWVTAFFELRMKAIELELAAATQFPNCPIPVVGLQYSPGMAPTEADRLIADACRMVRLDVFRLARIAESYARCLVILTMLRYREMQPLICRRRPKSHRRQDTYPYDHLAARRESMQEQCNKALDSLRDRLKRRLGVPEPPLDPGVKLYVEDAIQRLEQTIRFVQAQKSTLQTI